MYCVACGRQLPAAARFCWWCGVPVGSHAPSFAISVGAAAGRVADEWDHADFSIGFPPNLTPWYSLVSSRPPVYSRLPVRSLRLIDRAAESLTRRMKTLGWEPAEPTDSTSLWKAKRVEYRIGRRDQLWALMTFQARFDVSLVRVTIRFRRPNLVVAAAPGHAT